MLKEMFKYNDCSIFVVCNPIVMEAYITHTKDLYIHVGRILRDIKRDHLQYKNFHKNINDLVFDVHTAPLDDWSRKLQLQQLKDEYIKLGYKIVNTYNYFILKYHHRITKDDLVHVYLTDTRYNKYIVGIFESMSESNEFIESCYKNNKYCYPVYAFNKLTREYIESQKNDNYFYDMLKLR